MRVVIKKANTNEFYLGHGQWTTNRDAAKTFNHSIDALQECKMRKLSSEIVLSFRDPRDDVKISCRKKTALKRASA